MMPIIFRRVIFNSKIIREQYRQNKKKYMIMNHRKFYSLPTGPEDPNYFIIFLTSISTYYIIKKIINFK